MMDGSSGKKNITWDTIIVPRTKLLNFNFVALWKYRDLLMLFIRRNFVQVYKQTILGPLWFFIQPLLTTFTYVIIFSRVAGIPTDGAPKILFYMAGITIWGYFATCLMGTSNTFVVNQGLFGKVYFPRIVVPLAVTVTNLLKFGIQLLLFLGFWCYYYFTVDGLSFNLYMLLFPVLVVIMALTGMGMGLIISSLTTKYRDLTFLVGFGTQLMMYATPVVYPLSIIPPQYHVYIRLNPMANIIETFKYAFLGKGVFSWLWLLYSLGVAIVVFLLGMLIFNKTERSFIDTV